LPHGDEVGVTVRAERFLAYGCCSEERVRAERVHEQGG
jgi:hypothetical protein